MSWNFRIFLAALALFAIVIGVATRARAGDLTATWTAPATNCDGSPITNLAGFRAYWGPYHAHLADPALTSYTVGGLPPGEWWIGITAYNADGEESPIAGPVVKVIAAGEFVTSAPTVYNVLKHANSLLLLPVGTVPLGTPCDVRYSVNGRYAVARELVAWSGSIQPQIVVANCH
jgi:hypothetical protein